MDDGWGIVKSVGTRNNTSLVSQGSGASRLVYSGMYLFTYSSLLFSPLIFFFFFQIEFGNEIMTFILRLRFLFKESSYFFFSVRTHK